MFITNSKPKFEPVTITLSSPTELADLVGALTAYAKGKTKAKKSIREAGLLEHYSGNARKTARSTVIALAEVAGFSTPNFGSMPINEELVDEALSGDFNPCQ